MKRTLALLTPLVVAIGIVASGCGASDVTNDAVAKAAATTTSKHGSHVEMTMVMSSEALPNSIRMTASGEMDQVSKQANIDLDMSQLAGAAGIKASQFKVTEILNGTVFYMRFPFLDGKLPDNKKWLKIDLAKAGNVAGLNLGQALQPGQDPGQQLSYLRSVSNAKKVGTETIDGVQTTHYHGVEDLSRYPDLLPAKQRAAARAGVQKLIKAIGSSSYPIDAWVDKDNLIRRMHLVMSMNLPQAAGQKLNMDITENLSHFGTQVDATPPAAKDVYDATKLTGNALQQSLGG
jgi:hypothetical protein